MAFYEHTFIGKQDLSDREVEGLITKYSELIWLQIKEPSKITNYPGAIFLWVREMPKSEKTNGLTLRQFINPMVWFTYPDESAPRSYKIPYSKEKHRELRKAAEGRKTGVKTYVEIKKGKKEPGKPGHQEVDDGIRFKMIKPQDIIPKR